MNRRPVAIITGASRGIGLATALELAERGYDLALLAMEADELAAAAAEAQRRGAETTCLPGDLADLDYGRQAVEQTAQRYGRIDALVNNAAWRQIVSMRQITVESWEKTMRVCVTAHAFLSRWAAEHMERQGRGAIVNITSMMARQAAGICPAYIAAKGALNALTYELASLYGPGGVRVVAVAPGAIDTEMSRDLADDSTTRSLRQYSQQVISLGRWGSPAEIAALVAFLVSDAASYITGTVITADGGWHHNHMPLSLRRQMGAE